MNEQRLNAYLTLIQNLLACPSGEQPQILQDNQDLLDQDFLQVLFAKSSQLQEAGRQGEAEFLMNLAEQLSALPGKTNSFEDYCNFLIEVLQVVSESGGNPEIVYPLFQENLNKLDKNLANILTSWAMAKFKKVPLETGIYIAAVIVEFANLIQQFLLGIRRSNLEISIAAYQATVEIYTREAFPEKWAETQNYLGLAYCNRIKGEQAENIEMAIAFYQAALEIYTREAFPEQWAGTQNNLAIAYGNRIEGKKEDNIEQVIAACQNALKIYTREAFPEQWAGTQNNLAIAYVKRINEEIKDNIEIAIAACQKALEIYTPESFPEQWAGTQNNLAIAYGNRIEGKIEDNIEIAIAACQNALKIYTREAFPEDWARTQHHLALAYRNRIKGKIEDNIEQAIKSFRLALEIRTPEAFPIKCLQSGRNLGNTAFNAGFWKIAIEGYEQAIEAVEISRRWALTDDRRQEIMAQAVGVYDNIVQCYINLGQVNQAIEYAERSRSKRLVDLMASNDLYADGEIPPEVQKYLQDYDLLQQRIDQERELLRREFDSNKTLAATGSRQHQREAVEFSKDTIEKLEEEKQQLWEQIRSRDPVLSGQIKVEPLDFTIIQGLIETPKTAILNFYTTTNQTHIFILYKNQPPQLHTCENLSYRKLRELGVDEWLIPYLKFNQDWEAKMGNFLQNLAEQLNLNTLINTYLSGIEELIIIPHLFWHQIPFAALPLTDASESSSSQQPGETGRSLNSFLRMIKPKEQVTNSSQLTSNSTSTNTEYLGDKFRLRYVPSCQILEFCKDREKQRPVNLPNYGTIENPDGTLLGASYEGEKIAQLYNIPDHNRLKGREQGTVKKYRNLLEKVQVFHSSHHASCRLDSPLESKLILADGTITLGQIMTPGWRLPQLSDIFLSCCETNLGVAEVTDDILTLSTGFLCAGALSVVSTLWAVNDLATALFSIFYYQNRKQGDSRSMSLQMAQIKLRGLTKETLKTQYAEELESHFTEQFNQANAQKKQAKIEQAKQSKGTPEYEQWQKDYQYWNQIENSNAKESLKYFCNQQFPFEHPVYWAGFICSGLK
jgi:CHAT domain-containing protein